MYFFAIIESHPEVLLRETAAGRFASRVLDIVCLVEDDDIVIDGYLHRLSHPGIDQIVVRTEDDVRLLH